MAQSGGGFPDYSANALGVLAVGVLQVGLAISLSALIFTGPLADGAGRATASVVLGSGIVSLFVGWFSRMPITIVGAQDTSAIVLAAVAASMVAGNMDPERHVPTVMVTIALCALAAGTVFWLIGHRRLTGLVRYLPWPVITGFTAGTGWLLARGGIEVMSGGPLELDDLGAIVESSWRLLLTGLALGLCIAGVLSTRLSNALVSVAIVATVLGVHLVGRAVASADALEEQGWLIGPFPDDGGWTPIGPSDLRGADWGVIAGHALPISAVIGVSVVGVLLNLSGLESILDTEIDMDHELRSTGIANLGVAVSGGLVGWHLLGDTTMARKLGARGRTVPVTIGLLFFVVFAIGPGLVGQMPRSVAGGVLTGIGFNMLVDWARTTLPRLSFADRIVSVGILAAIAVLGVLPGVAIGIALAAIGFIRQSSRVDPARHVLAAAGMSTVDRSSAERTLLAMHDHSILAIELQGFLFFGSTLRIRGLLEEQGLDTGDTRFVVFDMARVTGIDSTAAAGLGALITRLHSEGVDTVITSLTNQIRDELERNQVPIGETAADLDHGISHCEEALLDDLMSDRAERVARMTEIPERLEAALEPRAIAAGEAIIETGDEDREVYFVQSGRFTTWIRDDVGSRHRLRQVRPGAVLGEIAFARGGRRTADVIADTDAEVLVLTREHFDELCSDRPDIALELQQLIMQRLANRLATTSAMVRDLMR